MYKQYLYDPDESVSNYQQKLIDRYLRNERQNRHQAGESTEMNQVEMMDPPVEPADNASYMVDNFRELQNELEAEYPTVPDDEMGVISENTSSNADPDNGITAKESRLLEPGINCCERDGCDDCVKDSRFIFASQLSEGPVENDLFDEEIDAFLSKDNKQYIKNIKSFDDLLTSSSSYETIDAQLNVSRAELFLMLMKFADKNDLSHSGLSALLGLINTMFKEPILPSSRYRLDQIFNSYHNVTYHATCPKCGEYLGNYKDLPDSSPCQSCLETIDCSKPSLKHMFSIVDPSKAVSDLIHMHEDYYDWVIKERVHKPGVITDIYDGNMYQQFVNNQLSPEDRYSYATAIMNSDGATPYEFSKCAVWPIYITINEIPIQARLSNVVVCGSWFGRQKPNLNVFLKPLVDTLNKLSMEGIRTVVKGEERTIKLFTIACSVDTMCRCSMQGTRQCNGRFGCCWCIHPGVHDPFSKSRKYGILNRSVPDRDDNSTRRLMELAAQDPDWIPVFGIKKSSPLLELNHFNLVWGFVVDYMHCCLIGVAKKIMTLILGNAEIEVLQDYMEKIKLPTHVRRTTKSIIDRKFWDAKDYENFVLYYSLPLLALVCDDHYVTYWALFVESMHVLVSSYITHEQLQKADRMLRQFVFETQENFTLSAMVYNIHMLLHVTRSVYDWGPLIGTSAFAFETANHYTMKAIKNAKGANLQIQRYINNLHCVRILEHTVLPRASQEVKDYYKTVLQSKIKHAIKTAEKITYLGLETPLDATIAALLQLSFGSKCYRRMVKDGCLYTSDLGNARTDNSVAVIIEGGNELYIEMKCFVIDNDEEYVLYKLLNTEKHELCNGLEQLQVISSVNDSWEKARINRITTICAVFQISNVKYVIRLPNLLSY